MTSSDGPEGWVESSVTPETKITAEMNERLRGEVDCDDPEPRFVLRGQDGLTPDTIWFYERACERAGLHEQAAEVRKAIEEIEDWQGRHPDRVKMPDHKHIPHTVRANSEKG